MKGNLEIVDRIKTERDEAIREVAELRGQLAVCEEHAGTMAKDFDGIVEAIKGQRDDLRAEVERMKADIARLEYILTGTGITREIIDKQMKGDE